MYWMMLLPSANVGRHFEGDSLPQSGFWGDLVLHVLEQFLRALAQVFRLFAGVLRALSPTATRSQQLLAARRARGQRQNAPGSRCDLQKRPGHQAHREYPSCAAKGSTLGGRKHATPHF